MDWMNNLFVVLILTTATGSVFYLVGLIFDRIWFGNDIRILRLQMQITQWAFLIPCVYAVLYIRERTRMSIAGSTINLFYNTPMMQIIFAILGFAWLFSFAVRLGRKLYMRHQRMSVFDGNIPEEDAETEAMFREICERLGIAGKVSLYRNDSVKMAYMVYWHGYAVVLPLERYSREETAVILYHELCHYLNRDILVGTVSCVVTLLHAINPFVSRLSKQLALACEEYCDRRACQEGAELFGEKEYFETILSVLNEEKRERFNLFMLADTMCDYEKRVLCMRRYHEHGGIKKGTAVVLSICFLIGSSIAALAVGACMTKAYAIVAQATDIRSEDNGDGVDFAEEEIALNGENAVEEFAETYDLNPDDVIMMGEDGIELVGDFINFDWWLEPGKTVMISRFLREEADKVTITTVGCSDDIKYQMGIKDSNEFMQYVEGTGTLQYDFFVSLKGGYYFFVTNLDSTRDLWIKGNVIE